MLTSRKITFLLCGILCLAASCDRKHHIVSRGFYYWKTVYKPSQFELATLHQLGVTKMYVRFFDVDEDNVLNHAVPVAPIRMGAKDSGFDYVPVVFITQKAIVALNESTIPELAQQICAFAERICIQSHIEPGELQIDCDWTSGSKEKYFALLKKIKEQPFMHGKTLSCTIRLNQVKYTVYNGVPPADRGLVMCYGMGSLKKRGPFNSILNADEAKDYLKHLDTYPLPLDIALPIFEWCVLFREDQYKGILHDVTTGEVKNSRLLGLKEKNQYACLQDSMWRGYRLKANDIVRVEEADYEDILSIANYSSQRIKEADISVILFDCDSITLKKFSKGELETIYNSYR